jgi:6-hydroxytryprostatin B O-methyltransferase
MGHTTFALAPACPDATFIVQDVDPVALDQGRQMLGGQYSALSPRISFQLHDIFQTQPTVADIYLFRHVFHDWSDADTVRILQSLAPTLKKGARVLVSEGIVPEPPAAAANTLDQKQILYVYLLAT